MEVSRKEPAVSHPYPDVKPWLCLHASYTRLFISSIGMLANQTCNPSLTCASSPTGRIWVHLCFYNLLRWMDSCGNWCLCLAIPKASSTSNTCGRTIKKQVFQYWSTTKFNEYINFANNRSWQRKIMFSKHTFGVLLVTGFLKSCYSLSPGLREILK